MDPSESKYRKKRIAHWNNASKHKDNSGRAGAFYHRLLAMYYRFLVPEGVSVLEVGCGNGDLIASLKPSFAVGIDFSEKMISRARQKHSGICFVCADAHDIFIDRTFDIIILSDLVNDLWDVQTVFEKIKPLCHAKTRIIINFYNNLWRIPLSIVKFFGLGADLLDQNWFAPNDIFNLLALSGFEVINFRTRILFPLKVFFLSSFFNKFLVNFVPFNWLALTCFVVARPGALQGKLPRKNSPSVSVVVAARNEAGNIENIFKSVPDMGSGTELIFVEGGSFDNTYDTIEKTIPRFQEKKVRLYRQKGRGKGDAVRFGFEKATGDILMILDADLTVPPKDLTRFYDAIVSGKGEFINGVRLVYPMEDEAMRFFNIVGNKFFSMAFSWLLEQPIKDTLCGTKVMWKRDYDLLVKNRSYFGDFDPFGDFDLLFGAAKLNLKIVEMPVRYRSRIYGDTNISRWRHGWLLLKMVAFAARRIKFI
ncbi:MAG: glycosyltransferase [Dissulfuribacterales bacterium]